MPKLDDLVGGRRGHHDLDPGSTSGRYCGMDPVEPIADRRCGSPVVTVPVVGRNEGRAPPTREAGRRCAGPHCPEESPAISHALAPMTLCPYRPRLVRHRFIANLLPEFPDVAAQR